MKHIGSLVMLLLVALAAPAWTAQPTDEEISAAKAQMEHLASEALTETVGVVNESGGFYPYAMVMREDKTVSVIAYNGDPDLRPTAEDFVQSLYWQVAAVLNKERAFQVAVLLKPHRLKGEEGGTVPGIWALVDHRDHDPWVMFLPFVDVGNGKFKLGDIMYLPSTDQLFLQKHVTSENDDAE